MQLCYFDCREKRAEIREEKIQRAFTFPYSKEKKWNEEKAKVANKFLTYFSRFMRTSVEVYIDTLYNKCITPFQIESTIFCFLYPERDRDTRSGECYTTQSVHLTNRPLCVYTQSTTYTYKRYIWRVQSFRVLKDLIYYVDTHYSIPSRRLVWQVTYLVFCTDSQVEISSRGLSCTTTPNKNNQFEEKGRKKRNVKTLSTPLPPFTFPRNGVRRTNWLVGKRLLIESPVWDMLKTCENYFSFNQTLSPWV